MIIIGLGTGRCGTVSLKELLGGCEDTRILHEHGPRIPWDPEEKDLEKLAGWFRHEDWPEYRGCVAHWYSGAVGFLAETFGEEIRFLCVRRPAREVAGSFIAQHGHRGFLGKGEEDGKDRFPVIEIDPQEEAWERYCEMYRTRTRRWALRFPSRFHYIDMHEMNSRSGQRRIFEKAGIPEENRTYMETCHFNRRRIHG